MVAGDAMLEGASWLQAMLCWKGHRGCGRRSSEMGLLVGAEIGGGCGSVGGNCGEGGGALPLLIASEARGS